jgi:hypothetical protein
MQVLVLRMLFPASGHDSSAHALISTCFFVYLQDDDIDSDNELDSLADVCNGYAPV